MNDDIGAYRPGLGALGRFILLSLIASALLFLVLRGAAVELIVVGDPMMAPTLDRGDSVFVSRWFPTPRPGDVVWVTAKGENYLRRVVTLEKAKVRVLKGVLEVDGQKLFSRRLPGDTTFSIAQAGGLVDQRKVFRREESLGNRRYMTYVAKKTTTSKIHRVRPGQLFVACDNRAYCRDSRHFGSLPLSAVRGIRVQDLWTRLLEGSLFEGN